MKLPSLVLALTLGTLHPVFAADAPRIADLAELDAPLERLQTSPVVIPEALRQAGVDDTVTLTAIVSVDGRVTRVEDVKAASPAAAEAATAAVGKWRFSPAFADGQPVAFRLPVAIPLRPGQPTDEVAGTGAAVGALGGAIMSIAEATFETVPEYPAALRSAPVDGYAMVSLFVDAEGRPSDAVTEFATRAEFAAAAAAVVQEWAFAPAMRDDKPVGTRTTVKVSFEAKSAAWDAETRDVEARLRYLRSFDEGPREKSSALVVYPYDALIAGRQGIVDLTVVIAPDGRVAKVAASGDSDPEFVAAGRASLALWEFFPATKAGRPVFGLIVLRMTFDPHREEFRFDDATHRLIADLRDGTANVLSLKQVDEFPKPVQQVAPIVPTDHTEATVGEAMIEIIIDPTGRVQLPRVLRATNPGLGWAAATAVAQWRFTPARKGGEPVTSRARVPVRFTPQAAPPAP